MAVCSSLEEFWKPMKFILILQIVPQNNITQIDSLCIFLIITALQKFCMIVVNFFRKSVQKWKRSLLKINVCVHKFEIVILSYQVQVFDDFQKVFYYLLKNINRVKATKICKKNYVLRAFIKVFWESLVIFLSF